MQIERGFEEEFQKRQLEIQSGIRKIVMFLGNNNTSFQEIQDIWSVFTQVNSHFYKNEMAD